MDLEGIILTNDKDKHHMISLMSNIKNKKQNKQTKLEKKNVNTERSAEVTRGEERGAQNG